MKLYRFVYSPYARKVQMLLELLGIEHEVVEVNYVEREELATVTGGYIMVPVLIEDDGTVLVDSRHICERIVETRGHRLVPEPLEGPIWAYSDFVDGPLEDILFRIASPCVRDRWTTAFERGLYVFSKERKFGTGCVDAWARDRDELMSKGRRLLSPTLRTLERRPFLFGAEPTLADAALYGVCAMLEAAKPELLSELSPILVDFARRLEAERRP
ncbi:MAG: glutathione S-transferase family protein [Polyangiaceae bacterium]